MCSESTIDVAGDWKTLGWEGRNAQLLCDVDLIKPRQQCWLGSPPGLLGHPASVDGTVGRQVVDALYIIEPLALLPRVVVTVACALHIVAPAVSGHAVTSAVHRQQACASRLHTLGSAARGLRRWPG